jgi:hypothetical protein
MTRKLLLAAGKLHRASTPAVRSISCLSRIRKHQVCKLTYIVSDCLWRFGQHDVGVLAVCCHAWQLHFCCIVLQLVSFATLYSCIASQGLAGVTTTA